MSKTVKLHTPAGRVRIVKRTGPPRDAQPISADHDGVFPSLHEGDQIHDGQSIGFPGLDGQSSFVQSNGFDLGARLKDEFKAGFDEGRRFTEKTLRDDLAANLAESKKNIESLTANVLNEYQRLHASAERNVVRLALAIAERIVKREIALDNETVLRQIHAATKRVIGVEQIKIRVNPKDEEYVREHRTQILATTDAVRELVIEGDETIERGGCVLESDSGNVDALIATQLERIELALLGEQGEK